jgi:hypothetical protein
MSSSVRSFPPAATLPATMWPDSNPGGRDQPGRPGRRRSRSARSRRGRAGCPPSGYPGRRRRPRGGQGRPRSAGGRLATGVWQPARICPRDDELAGGDGNVAQVAGQWPWGVGARAWVRMAASGAMSSKPIGDHRHHAVGLVPTASTRCPLIERLGLTTDAANVPGPEASWSASLTFGWAWHGPRPRTGQARHGSRVYLHLGARRDNTLRR